MLTLEALQCLLQHVKQGIDSVAEGEPSKQPQTFIDREQQCALQAAAASFVKQLEDNAAIAGANNVGIMSMAKSKTASNKQRAGRP